MTHTSQSSPELLITMVFRQFDPSGNEFDERTQNLLVLLANEFGTVELQQIDGAMVWCVRIYTEDADTDRLPLAAMGETPFVAAERLVRICGLRNPDR